MKDNYNYNENISFGFSKTFIKIMNKYLKEEKKKKKRIDLIKKPNKFYFFEKLYKKEGEKGNNDEDDLKDIFLGENIDFDKHKYYTKNKNKIDENYKKENKRKKNFRFLFVQKENEKNKIGYNNENKKRIYKSLSKNLLPSITKCNNIKLLEFPKIFPEKESFKNKQKNLLIKTNSFSNLNSNYNRNNTFKTYFSLKGTSMPKKPLIKSKNKVLLSYLRRFNKTNYYHKLTLLSNKSKQISKNLSFYSNKSINIEKDNNKLNYKYL